MNFKIFIYIPQKMIIYEKIEYQLVVIYFIAQPIGLIVNYKKFAIVKQTCQCNDRNLEKVKPSHS